MKKILQAFKRIFKRKPRAYVCDPNKAVGCSKDGCWYISHGPCKCTKNKKYAQKNSFGKPVVATEMDLWNSEYYEYWMLRN